MEPVHQRLGPQMMVDHLADLGTEDMPQHDLYEDESQDDDTVPISDAEPEATPGQEINA